MSSARQDFNESLRERLNRLAQQGDIVARYLFSKWKPDYFGQTDAFLLQQDWESKAREYSYQNLEQGELLGFLAFEDSFSHGIYTKRDSEMAVSFAAAAIECGFINESLQRSVDRMFNDERLSEWRERSGEQVLKAAEGLIDFCQ